MRRHRRRELLTLLALWLGLASDAAAQTSAALAGTVRDSSGQTLSNAQIVVQSAEIGSLREAVSGPHGEYEIAGLPPGHNLEFVVTLAPFATVRRTIDSLTAGERRLFDVRLEPAGINERVIVSSDAVIGLSSSPELGGHLTRDQVERVPVNGRDLISLAYLIPGAAPARGFYNLAPRLTINGASSLVTNNELGVLVGQLRADWRPQDAGPRVVVTDRGATLAVLGAVSDNFSWTERDLQVRDVYSRLIGRHSLKAGAGMASSTSAFRLPYGPTPSSTIPIGALSR